MDESPASSNFEIEVPSQMFPPVIDESIPYQFIRMGTNSIPATPESQQKSLIPPFIIFRPIVPDVQVPVINCKKGDIPKCGTCKSYLSAFVKTNPESSSYRCPVCAHLNSTLHFSSIYDMRTYIDRQELHNLVYDIIPPNNLNCSNGYPRVYFLIIDESLLCTTSTSYQILLDEIEAIKSVVRPDDQIGLITYGASVTVYTLSTRKAQAFTEFEASFLLRKDPLIINALTGLPLISDILKDRASTKEPRYTATYSALLWALECLSKYGGKAILFTSGRVSDQFIDLIEIFVKNSVSLSIFKKAPVDSLNTISLKTGGIVAPFGQTEMLLSLFTMPTGWDSVSVLRLSPNLEISSVLGPFTQDAKISDLVSFPIIDSSQSIIFEVNVKEPAVPLGVQQNLKNPVTEFAYFQLAFRFTDDQGIRKIRVINGRAPFTDIPKLPIDESALSLFLLRKRLSGMYDEVTFRSKVINIRNSITTTAMFPLLLYTGTVKDRSLVLSAAVEKYTLSALITTVRLGERVFQMIWATSNIFIFPEPNEEEIIALRLVASKFGIPCLKEAYPTSQEDFQNSIVTLAEAEQWYRNLI